MSTLSQPAGIDYASPTTPKPIRLASLDFFRGLTIAGMLLVNNSAGRTYDPLEHSQWHGWTPTDLVFPFFLFIMGVAIPFSFAKRAATDSKKELFLHVLARGVSLFLLGDMLYGLPYVPPSLPPGFGILFFTRIYVYTFLAIGFILLLYPWKRKSLAVGVPFVLLALFICTWNVINVINRHAIQAGLDPSLLGGNLLNPSHLRIPGVLQRIGAVYVGAAGFFLLFRWRGLVVTACTLLAIYLLLMCCVPYPSFKHDGQMVHNLWTSQDNFARFVDISVFTGPNGNHVYGHYPDPEGLVSTLPAIVTSLLGILAGLWLRTERPLADRCASLLSFGVLAFLFGYVLNAVGIPINKALWTPSYVFVAAGLALLGLGTFFYLSDVRLIRKPFFPLKWYGMNAIAAFVLAGVLPRVNSWIRWHTPVPDKPDHITTLGQFWSHHLTNFGRHITLVGDPTCNGSVAYALSFVLVVGAFMAVMYRLRIFLKV